MKVGGETIVKRHFHILKGYNGKKRITDNGFLKHVYQRETDNIILVHYLGDESISTSRPHGNSKQPNSVFVRTQPSVLEFMENQVKTSGDNPHKIYKKIVSCGQIPNTLHQKAPQKTTPKKPQDSDHEGRPILY